MARRRPLKPARALAGAIAALVLAGAAEGGGGATASKGANSSDYYLKIEPVTGAITHDFKARGVLHVELGLDIRSAQTRRRADALIPRLRAACSEALRQYLNVHYSAGRTPDADAIRTLMQEAVNGVLREDGAVVLLAMVLVHGK